jgi:hypothetical protein
MMQVRTASLRASRCDVSSQPDDEIRVPLSSDSQNAEERSSIIRLMELTGNDLNPVL